MKIMKKQIILITAVGVIVLALAYNFLAESQKTDLLPLKTVEAAPKTLKIGQISLNVEIADTDAKREQGLSGKKELAENEGMLFVFNREGYYGFWMKDMNFPIDIAWLDKNKKIIYIEKNVSPETYPKIFNSSAPSLYVLEVHAEFLGKNNIKIGNFVAF
jgi:uncharacterized protein